MPDAKNNDTLARTEILAEDQWILEQLNLGTLDNYQGEFIAVYNKQIVAHDHNSDLAKKKALLNVNGVHKNRLVVRFVHKLV